MGSVLNGEGDLVTNDTGKTDMFNGFFVLISTSKTCLHKGSRDQWKSLEEGRLSLGDENQVREFQMTLVKHKSLCLGGIHPCMLRKLADIIVWPIVILGGLC